MIALPFTFRVRNGHDEARCHECGRWCRWEKGRFVDVHASRIPQGWPLGFKLWLCSQRCEEKATA
jgi:hypothetical protein